MKPDSSESDGSEFILFFDGCCALCHGSVKFSLWADPDGPLKFAPLEGETAAARLRNHPELAGLDSLVLLEGDRVFVRSTAVLKLLRYLGGPWQVIAFVGRWIPREIRDSLYDVVAHWRYRMFGRYPTCPIPAAPTRGRFLP